ncbi:MAG: hypothetical protein WAO20_01720, partial [Acidobacteriota bacterium]
MINRGHLLLFLPGLFVLSLGGHLLWAQTPLSCGDRVEGEISTPGERDLYQFEGNQGEAIQVVGESIDPGLQLEIQVLDPSGVLIGSKSIASPRSGSIKLPETGQYRLAVRDFLDQATGRYALSLQFTTGRCAVPIDCGDSREGPVSKRAEQAAFSFEGHAGEAVRVTTGLESSASKYPVVEVFGPGGNRLGWSPSGDSGSLVLTEDGTHTLLLSGFYSFFDQPHPDRYGVSLQFSTGQCASPLGDGGVLERSVDRLVQQDAVAFEAGASSWVHLESEALDYDPWTPQFTLFDQLGTQVETAAGSPVDFFIPRDGSYTAVVASRGVPRRTFRTRLGLPASRLTAVTERLYQSPVEHSAVAFSSRHDEYLAVYALDVSGFGEYEIYGRLLDAADLQPKGDEFRVSRMGPELDPQFQAADPDVTYDPVGDRYLVVWSGEKSTDGKFEVYGQFLSAGTGTAIGQDDFNITSTGSATNTAFGSFRPKVRSLPSSGQFYLVWHADTRQDGAFDVFGQRLAASGSPLGSPARLNGVATTNAATSSRNPSLAYDADQGEFLVVWQGPGATGAVSAIRAARVNAATGTIVSPGEFIISDATDEAPPVSSDAPPDVSFSRSEGVYLVVWSSAGGRILGRRVNAATGTRLGFGSTPLNSGSGGSLPRVSRTGADREFLVTWQQDRGGGELEISGQRIDSLSGLRKGELQLQISRVGPDGDSRYAARFPSLCPEGRDDGYLLLWAGNARPSGGNHLTATDVPFHDSRTTGDLNWVLSARETPSGTGGPLFSGAVSTAGEDGLVVTGGFGALTRMDSDASVLWSLRTSDFTSE